MLWVPQKGRVRVITNVSGVGSATPGTAVVSNGTTLLTGAVVELISAASNIYDSWGLEIFVTATGLSATASEAKIDILIGGATDDILINSLICGYTVTPHGVRYFFPVHVPAGVRVAAQIRTVAVSVTARCCVWLYGGGIPPFRVARKITTYGTATNGARGVAVVPAASGGAATETQIVASTTEDHFGFHIGFQPATDTTITPAGFIALQLGVGAVTADKVGPVYLYGKDTGEVWTGPSPSMPVLHDVPSGTRLSVWSSNSGVNDAAYDSHIYALS